MEKSKWVLTEDSALRCEIEHIIPRFGKAVFYQESGRRLQLKILSDHRFKKDMAISFRSVTANWKGIQTEANLASLKTSGTSPLVRVVSNAAREAYFELQQGFQPSLFFVDDEDGFNSVAVILSTVNFRDIEDDFGSCLTRLYPYHFDDIKHARVHFDFDEEFPTLDEEDRALTKLLDYLTVDKSVKTVLVTGHTDFKGTECYNDTLSARRAWYVYDYLIQSGIEPKMLQMEFKGESSPRVKGKDDLSRAKNRRVEVILQK
ncbi:MAG: OmpA family protein [Gammaproteobacteria bacterium]|nr:OmpA family protein [Gammaproteobacteria bacterium]